MKYRWEQGDLEIAVKKSAWSRVVELVKELGGGGVSSHGSEVLTTGDLRVNGGLLAPQQGLKRRRTQDKPAPEPLHGVDDKYFVLDPISGKASKTGHPSKQ